MVSKLQGKSNKIQGGIRLTHATTIYKNVGMEDYSKTAQTNPYNETDCEAALWYGYSI